MTLDGPAVVTLGRVQVIHLAMLDRESVPYRTAHLEQHDERVRLALIGADGEVVAEHWL